MAFAVKTLGRISLGILLLGTAGSGWVRAQNGQEQSTPEQDNSNRPATDAGGYARQDRTETNSSAPNSAPMQRADGKKRGDLPIEAYAVAPGTKFMVRLEEDLSTDNTREGKRFHARTLEPLEAGSGIYLPAGAEIDGHVSRVEPAGVAGRARLFLTFDEIRTRFGALPIVADVTDVPGDHSIRIKQGSEGILEGKTTTQQAAGQAAGEGAALGAVHGVKDKNAKEAAEGALAGAIAAYLMESGRGHELNLLKGAKLELELERALYLVKE